MSHGCMRNTATHSYAGVSELVIFQLLIMSQKTNQTFFSQLTLDDQHLRETVLGQVLCKRSTVSRAMETLV